MGASGDMLMSAFLELHENPDKFIEKLNSLGIPKIRFKKEVEKKCGIMGTHINVMVDGIEETERIHKHNIHSEHHHSDLKHIEHIIEHLNLSKKVKNDVISVYKIIAEAESSVHGCSIENIHFHEVGTMDAIADIVGVCSLINELNVEKIIASSVNTGRGQVKCAHGVLPVPAPATAYILKGIPIYSNNIKSELCTPTGAALLKYFVSEFGEMPIMRVLKIGYGFGTKDFEEVNCVRAFLGETGNADEKITELICNLDDMTGEGIGFAINRLFNAGALEVFTSSIMMKKNRPAVMLTCVCREAQREEMLRLIFKHTSTIGIRENVLNRYVLDKTEKIVSTEYGDVRVKESKGYGVVKMKAEYDDLEKIALENNITISDIQLKNMLL
jgi:hypothetical protein